MIFGKIKAHFGIEVEVLDRLGSDFRVKVARNSGHVVGDEVQIDNERLTRLERRNSLSRKTNYGNQILAANIDYVGIVVSVTPKTPMKFIDQIIISARVEGIEPLIIVTKLDLKESAAYLEEIKKVYQKNILILEGESAVQSFIGSNKGKYILLGVSGAGKSTLMNKLSPKTQQKTGELSDISKLGKHTTSSSLLIEIGTGSELIDSPGVRDFTPIDISAEEIAKYFPGFEEFRDKSCKFRNCKHIHEPGCLVKKQARVEDYERYLGFVASE